MKKDKKGIPAQAGKTLLTATPLGLPKEMNITDICRGMQTGWPQLIAAMHKLRDDPRFCNTFRHSYASGHGLSIGQPQQLKAALMVDPSFLMKSAPPADIYGWSVWITARVYEATQTINVTLEQIPTLIAACEGAPPAETGMLVRDILTGAHGLSRTAGNIAGLANAFAIHLGVIGGDLEAAQTEYQAIGVAFEMQQLSGCSKNMINVIGAHTNAVAATHQQNKQLDDFQSAAAKVTAFAVIANMGLAMQSLAVAWQATKVQFEATVKYAPENLSDIHFLQSTLKLGAALGEWAAFSDAIRNFMNRALLSH